MASTSSAHCRSDRSHHPRAAWLLLAAFLLLAPMALAQAPKSEPPEMLRLGRRNLETKLAELLPTVKDSKSTLNAIRELTDMRRLAQRVVAMEYPLDDFAGILLVDGYDEAYVASIDTLTTKFGMIDQTPVQSEALTIFRDRLGELPPIGDTPAGFVVAFVISRCGAAATGLPDSVSTELKQDVAEVAVRAIGELAHNYVLTRTGEARQKSDDFWHLSVVERMRCSQHNSGYKVQEERNGLRPDGSLYRRYVVSCETGLETRKLDFDLGIIGAMSQTGGRQNLKKVKDPGSRRPGVDP
jgi:hypothetical protein